MPGSRQKAAVRLSFPKAELNVLKLITSAGRIIDDHAPLPFQAVRHA